MTNTTNQIANTTRHVVINLPRFLIGLPTAITGYAIHHSIFWSIMDYLFYPLAWAKWLILQEVNLTIIKTAFSFFLK